MHFKNQEQTWQNKNENILATNSFKNYRLPTLKENRKDEEDMRETSKNRNYSNMKRLERIASKWNHVNQQHASSSSSSSSTGSNQPPSLVSFICDSENTIKKRTSNEKIIQFNNLASKTTDSNKLPSIVLKKSHQEMKSLRTNVFA